MTIHKFGSLNNIFEAANVVEQELKEEKVPKYKGISSSNSWSKTNGGDFKKPYENKPFEGNTPKYPPREEGEEFCLGEGVDQEKGCEEETREEDEFEGDEDEEQDPCDRKHVVVPNGLMMKAPTEEAWSQEGEFTVLCMW
ncbi:hypothetical protein KY285_030510 [Solanum tuberosum]|nr:hypothetical protein KY285_030510 [Solanum tuberosum]